MSHFLNDVDFSKAIARIVIERDAAIAAAVDDGYRILQVMRIVQAVPAHLEVSAQVDAIVEGLEVSSPEQRQQIREMVENHFAQLEGKNND